MHQDKTPTHTPTLCTTDGMEALKARLFNLAETSVALAKFANWSVWRAKKVLQHIGTDNVGKIGMNGKLVRLYDASEKALTEYATNGAQIDYMKPKPRHRIFKIQLDNKDLPIDKWCWFVTERKNKNTYLFEDICNLIEARKKLYTISKNDAKNIIIDRHMDMLIDCCNKTILDIQKAIMLKQKAKKTKT